MSAQRALLTIFSACARLARKVRRTRRFDKTRASRKLYREIRSYWVGGLDALFDHLEDNSGWDKIARHVGRQTIAAGQVQKALSDDDRKLIVELLAEFGYYDDIDKVAAAIVEATLVPTFEQAATLAMKNLGIVAPSFELRNEAIRTALLERKSAGIFATRNNIDAVMETIVRNFYELGSNPYDKSFLRELRKDLGNVATYQAERFALTETAIAAEWAQLETWQRNGVQRKQWNALGRNTRASHQAMHGKQAGIDEPFLVASSDGEIYEAMVPSDRNLPAHELINCRCWATAVVDDEYQIDPARIWEGQ